MATGEVEKGLAVIGSRSLANRDSPTPGRYRFGDSATGELRGPETPQPLDLAQLDFGEPRIRLDQALKDRYGPPSSRRKS